MQWVPLAQSGLQYRFLDNNDVPGLPPFVTFNTGTSVIALSQPGTPLDRDASWTLEFPNSPEVKVRITANSFLGRGIFEGSYDPAYFTYRSGSSLVSIPNEAGIGEGGDVDSFIPAQFTASLHENQDRGEPAWLYYGSSSYLAGDTWTEIDLAWAFLIEVLVDSPEPPVEPCCPLSNSRLFKGIASKYRAAQHQPIRARRSQKRCLQVDFNGALDEGDTITQVTWECVSPWITFMEKAGIGENGRYVCVDVTFNYPGIGYVKATVDTASGSRENYEFEVTVSDAPMYPTAQYIPSNGPYQLVATA